MSIQAVMFNKDTWTKNKADKWLKEKNYFPYLSYRITPNFFRFRLIEPDKNKKYRIFSLPNENSIKFILEYPKGGTKTLSLKEAGNIISKLNKHVKGLIPTGSYARGHEHVNDLDFLTLRKLSDILEDILNNFDDVLILRHGHKILSFILDDVKFDIWFVPNSTLLPFYQIEFGQGKNNIHLKKIAKDNGYKLSVNGLQNLKTKNYVQNLTSPNKIISFILNLEYN